MELGDLVPELHPTCLKLLTMNHTLELLHKWTNVTAATGVHATQSGERACDEPCLGMQVASAQHTSSEWEGPSGVGVQAQAAALAMSS